MYCSIVLFFKRFFSRSKTLISPRSNNLKYFDTEGGGRVSPLKRALRL